MQWLKHAFAVEKPGPAEPTEEQKPVVDRICKEIVKRHLTTPSLMFLEMSRPLNYIGSQVLHFFAPFISAISDADGHKHLAAFLEHRGSIDYICRRIEELEAEAGKRDSETPNSSPGNKPGRGCRREKPTTQGSNRITRR